MVSVSNHERRALALDLVRNSQPPFHFSLSPFPFRSVDAELRLANDGCPFRQFRADDGGELVGRLGGDFERLGAQPLLGFGLAQDPDDIAVDLDRKSTRLNSSHIQKSRMPSSA